MNKSNCHLINQKWFYRDFDKQLNKIHPKLFLYPKVNHPHGLFDKMESQSTKHLGSLPDSWNGLPVQFSPLLYADSFLSVTHCSHHALHSLLKNIQNLLPQGRVSSASEILCGHQHLTPKMNWTLCICFLLSQRTTHGLKIPCSF